VPLLPEIRRRKVFQVAAVYAVVAWLLVQVVVAVGAPLNLPSWFATAVIVLLAVGFPVALIIAWAFDASPQGLAPASAAAPSPAGPQPASQRLGVLMQAIVLIAVGFLVVNQFLSTPGGRPDDGGAMPARPGPASRAVQRFRTSVGTFEAVSDGVLSTDIALSRDGRTLAYVENTNGQAQLYVRSLDQFDARALPGTEGAFRPFFSPDGEWIGFYSDQSDQKLKKVSIRGGAPITLADAPFASGAVWASDGTIVFVTRQNASTVPNARTLFRVSANGGTPEILLAADDAKGYGTPEVLPGGEAVLLATRLGTGGAGRADQGRIDVLSLATGDLRTLIEGGFAPKYAASGHIVFYRSNGLWAVPFDAARLQTTGREMPVVDGVQADNLRGFVPYSISDDGLLIYVSGSVADPNVDNDIGVQRTLLWVDRDGREELVPAPPRWQMVPSLSPDGQRVALMVNSGGNGYDIWITDLRRGTSSRLTFDSGSEGYPFWTPDGQHIVFAATDPAGPGLRRIVANGAGRVEPLPISAENFTSQPLPMASLPNGNFLAVSSTRLVSVALDGETASATPVLEATPPQFLSAPSPDGRWIAYESNETGRLEIYVRPFPNVDGGKWQVSADGGEMPRWARDGSEIFYRSGAAMMSVPVATAPAFSAGAPVRLFEGNYGNGARPDYDVAPDGRFLMLPYTVSRLGRVENEQDVTLSVVYNWFEELERLAPRD
jgi:Tol biopolymer transport system component